MLELSQMSFLAFKAIIVAPCTKTNYPHNSLNFTVISNQWKNTCKIPSSFSILYQTLPMLDASEENISPSPLQYLVINDLALSRRLD